MIYRLMGLQGRMVSFSLLGQEGIDPVTGWWTVAIQAGGAIAVCGMFIWYLTFKQKQDDAARQQFLDHLTEKDKASQTAMQQQMEYLRHRDSQSKEIAQTGHAALRELSERVKEDNGKLTVEIEKLQTLIERVHSD